MKKVSIVTHTHPDLDSIFSVLLAKHAAGRNVALDIKFVPASIQDHEIPPGYRPLDVASGKGETSCLAAMPEAALLPSNVVEEVDTHDSTGQAEPRVPLSQLVAAVRVYLLTCGVAHNAIDLRIIEIFDPIVGGLIRLKEMEVEGAEIANSCQIVTIGPYRFAVPPRDVVLPQSGGEILAKTGVVGSVYHDGENLGIFRFPGVTAPDLGVLRTAPEFEGWFVHPNGFLACWGSKKAPATQPPPDGTPQNQDGLIEVLESFFASPIEQPVAVRSHPFKDYDKHDDED